MCFEGIGAFHVGYQICEFTAKAKISSKYN